MKYKKISVLALAMFIAAPGVSAAANLETHEQKYSYALGYRLADSLKAEGLIVDPEQFSRAIQDSMSGKDPAMTADAMQAAARTARYMLDAENEARSAVAISLKGGNPSPSHLVLF